MQLPELPPFSTCGFVTYLVCSLIAVILSSVAFSATWWSVWFWDCSGALDTYYYINLEEGLCWDTEDDVSSDWDYCNEWGTSTTDSDYEDAQDTYEAAHGLIVTGMVFVIVAALLLVFFQFLPMEPFKKFFRFGAIFFYGLSGVFFAIALATASDTYLTDVATYGQNDYCSSTATFPNVAWAFGFLSVFVSVMLSWSLYQPCGGCRDNNPQQGIDESLVGNENDK